MDKVAGLAWSWWGQRGADGPGGKGSRKSRVLECGKGGRRNENDQAGILGLGMVLPVTEPSRELYTRMTPPKSGPGGWIRADMEGRRSTRYRATPDDKYSASGQGPLLLGV